MIKFLPSPIADRKEATEGQIKSGPSGTSGICLGYKILPGGKWRGEVYAATLDDLANQDLSYFAKPSIIKVHIQTVRIKEVDFGASKSVIRFPLQENTTGLTQT